MILAIDVGNTRIKVAVFEADTVLYSAFFDKIELQKKIQFILESYRKIDVFVVSSVGNIDKDEFFIWEKILNVYYISHKTPFPFKNLYETPYTLGIDRMVLASGAVLKFPNQNRLIIDAGTCITYDFVDSENNYQGGAISPGIRLRYESLHHYTANLPLLTLLDYSNNDNQVLETKLIGDSTIKSIHTGVIYGMVNEIDGFINQYKDKYSNFIIILTGGDAEFLAKRLKNTIFANSNFLLESLNQTYQYKIKND